MPDLNDIIRFLANEDREATRLHAEVWNLSEDEVEQFHRYTLNGTCHEGGSVESPVGWFAYVEPDTLGTGHGPVIMREDQEGRKYGWEFRTEERAQVMWDGLIRDFNEWNNQVDLP
jgi:hypothetical protein